MEEEEGSQDDGSPLNDTFRYDEQDFVISTSEVNSRLQKG
jgi:hypothetical protein